MNYQEFANEIINIVGGEKNIKSLVHCSTRLRFTLHDESKVNDQAATENKKILSVVKKGGQYQLVIGNDVDKVYNEIVKHIKIEGSSKSEGTKQSIVNKVLSTITGSIAPVIPILAGAGMGKVLLIVLNMLGILDKTHQTYYILNFIFDTGFYFLPVFIGFSAAKMFNCNQYLAAFVCLTMLHPSWDALVKLGNPVHFFAMPVELVKYSSQLIPALLTVWAMSYIEKFVYKIVPDMVKVFLAPLLVVLITTPIALIAVGPVASYLAQLVADSVLFLQEHTGFIAIPILVMLYPWLVSVGLHKALSPITVMLVQQKGYDPIIRVIALCSNMSQAAAALAVSIKSKNKELKQLAFSASITAFFGGITEPAMYGVNLRLKKPMYACMVGGGVAGVFAGVMKLKAFVYATPGLLSLPMWVSDVDNQIVNAIITLIIASIVTFIATFIIGFDDPVSENLATENSTNNESSPVTHKGNPVKLTAPLAGQVIPLDKVNDETFASGIMGSGIAVIPETGLVTAPGNGIVAATFTSGHAIGLKLDNDIEMLIHVGIDTVGLDGKYFTTKVEKGQRIKQGETLIEFDLEALKREGYDITTMIIITNSNDYLDIIKTEQHAVDKNVVLMTVF
ncbi:beta-glucoside-specific PTS transporter subunit IIABC [Zophobihabitans entericus]|uniref:PTS transporter subunit EIIC n=1 Tax=Zophobihabitans entericus TaxID=1635327 RepID=A0A6G9IBQ5_9GAMM|nr:beta-glucoside-specific PTS transporter subunit IIABC [Zophobihabitans entericus]QIQ21666.1 PTS transporter subunit EIIC [Zophobihabitans entericus]